MGMDFKSWIPNLRHIPIDEAVRQLFQSAIYSIVGAGGLLTVLASSFGNVPQLSSVAWLFVFLGSCLGVSLIWLAYEQIVFARGRNRPSKADVTQEHQIIDNTSARHPEFSTKGLYVSSISIEDKCLNDLNLPIGVIFFNASGSDIAISVISGTVVCSSNSIDRDIRLVAPYLMRERSDTRHIPNLAEAIVVVGFRVPKGDAELMQGAINAGGYIYFDFPELEIRCDSLVRAGDSATLPLWQRVRCQIQLGFPVSSRAIIATAHITG